MLYIISGTYDPLHKAHLGIAEYLETRCDIPSENIYFELSSVHCDKKKTALSFEERYNQFARVNRRVITTLLPTFTEKLIFLKRKLADFFPEHKEDRITFCMGEDTFERFTSPASYFDSPYERNRALKLFRENGGTALVLPRGTTEMVKNNKRWEFNYHKMKEYNHRCEGFMGQFVQFIDDNYVPSHVSSSNIRNTDLLKRATK